MADPKEVEKFVHDIIPDLIDLRHDIHQHAEISGNEKRTEQAIKNVITKLSPDRLVTDIGSNGMIAEFDSGKEGPVILFRSELDGLPIHEANDDLPYKSEDDGASHKCGHDGHMAILCGLANMISNFRPQKGKILILFQPAEETGEGAQWMLDDPKMKEFSPDYVFALHNVPGYHKHEIVTRPNIFSSASTGLIIRLKGETSHASHPENGRNPALAMAHLVEHLMALPQLTTSFEESALVTVIHARLGEIAFGTSPGEAEVMATLRSHENDVLDKLCNRAEEIAKKTAELHNLDYEVEWTQKFEATINDKTCVGWIDKAAENLGLNYQTLSEPFSWSEDFGRFTGKFKGAMFGLGSGKRHPQLHNSTYDFPDEIIQTGALMFYSIASLIADQK